MTSLAPIQARGAKPPGHELGWENIDELLASAASEMSLGEMIHRDDFSLYAAMSATELMDPKMDHGMNRMNVLPVRARLGNGQLKLRLSAAESLEVMDSLFSVEMLHYFKGFASVQTLYTCFYTHECVLKSLQEIFRPTKTNSEGSAEDAAATLAQLKVSDQREEVTGTLARVLHAYVILTLQTADMFQMTVKKADIYEDDDFYPRTFGLYGATELDKDVTEEIMRSALLMAKRHGSEGAGCADDVDEKVAWDSIIARMELRFSFWKSCKQLSDVDFMCSDRDALRDAVVGLEVVKKHLAVVKRVAFAKSEESSRTATQNASESRLGFDYLLAGELMPNAPPRHLDVPTFNGACDLFSSALDNMLFATSECLCIPTCEEHAQAMRKFNEMKTRPLQVTRVEIDPLTNILSFLQQFTCRDADIFSRSVSSLMLKCKDKCLGLGSLTLILTQATLAFGVPPWMVEEKAGEEIISLMSISMLYLFRTKCLSPARQHRRLLKNLKDLGGLQVNADYFDEQILRSRNIPINSATTPYYMNRFGSWVLDRALSVMVDQLMLGFSCNLYSSSEAIMVYWFIENLLLTTEQNLKACLKQYENMLCVPPLRMDIEFDQEGLLVERKLTSKQKKKLKKRGPPRSLPPTPFYYHRLFHLEAEKSKCSGMLVSLLGLRVGGFLEPANYPFGSEEFRFEGRFKHFYLFDQSPPKHFQYDYFVKSTQADLEKSCTDLVQNGCTLLKQSGQNWKKMMETINFSNKSDVSNSMLGWVKSEQKSAVVNMIFLSKLTKQEEAPEGLVVVLNEKGLFEEMKK